MTRGRSDWLPCLRISLQSKVPPSTPPYSPHREHVSHKASIWHTAPHTHTNTFILRHSLPFNLLFIIQSKSQKSFIFIKQNLGHTLSIPPIPHVSPAIKPKEAFSNPPAWEKNLTVFLFSTNDHSGIATLSNQLLYQLSFYIFYSLLFRSASSSHTAVLSSSLSARYATDRCASSSLCQPSLCSQYSLSEHKQPNSFFPYATLAS